MELSGLGMLESYHKLQQKPKTVPKFKNVLQLIWSALPEKAIDSAAKARCKWLQACVSANVIQKWYNSSIYSDKWTKIGENVEIYGE